MLLDTKVSKIVELLDLIPHPEGGFFRETFRSGCEPMTTRALTGTVNKSSLVLRYPARDNQDLLRNALTSIYWMPTLKSRILPLIINKSDHVHYYHGGLPFCYLIYNPRADQVERIVLGPDVQNGQKLQVAVPGSYWKTGFLIVPDSKTDDNNNFQFDTNFVVENTHGNNNNNDCQCPDALTSYEYALIGEAVGPGFDLRDFATIEETELVAQPEIVQQVFKPFLHTIKGAKNVTKDFDSHYDNDEDVLQQRRQARS